MGRQHGRLGEMLGAVLLLNLADLVLTLYGVLTGMAEEANPVMAAALAHGPLHFGVAKIGLVSLSVGLLWRLREHATARRASVLCLLAYVGVTATHVWHLA